MCNFSSSWLLFQILNQTKPIGLIFNDYFKWSRFFYFCTKFDVLFKNVFQILNCENGKYSVAYGGGLGELMNFPKK